MSEFEGLGAQTDADGMGAVNIDSQGTVEPVGRVPPKAPSELDKKDLFEVLRRWFLTDAEFTGPWRIQAKEDFRFVAGDQWSDVDKALLNAQQRPHIVFNRVLTILKAIAGMEINGRHEIQFIPSHNEVTAPNELLSAASKWMAEGCDAEDEESEGFSNMAVCGMGWTESRLNYEDDPAGLYIEESVDPLEMYWDHSCKKKNLSTAERIARCKKIPMRHAMQLFPGKTRHQLDATWALGNEVDQAVKSVEEKRRRDTDDGGSGMAHYDDSTSVTVVEIQWIERETYYLIADDETGQKLKISEKHYQNMARNARELAKRIPSGISPMPPAARLMRKKFKRAFLGSEVLEVGDAPIKGRFSWACMTGELDRNKGTWFGLVKVMHDPQMWANKWLSQMLHILNTTAKGGIVAEEDAFADMTEAEEKWAMPDTIVWATTGAVSQQKIMPKPGAGIVQAYVDLMQFAITSIRDCTGINLELLGQKDINQPGILEAQRKQAGMTVLATLFDSLRRYRKFVGRIRLYLIQTYLSDGRLIRIAGPDGARSIPLLRDKTFGEYDVIVDDTPTSPNQKEANWAIIQPLLAIFKDQILQNPKLFAELLEYSPLPNKLVESIKDIVLADERDPNKQQDAATNKQLATARIVAAINKDQSTAEMNNAKAGASQATASYDLAMAQHMLASGEFEKLKMHLETMKAGADVQKSQFDAQKAQHDAAAKQRESRLKLLQHLAGVGQDHHDRLKDKAEFAHQRQMDVADHHLEREKMAHDQAMQADQHQMQREQMTHDQVMAQQASARDDMAARSGVERNQAAAQKDRAAALQPAEE